MAQLMPQHLFLVEVEGRVVGGHGEQQQELLLRPAVVQRQPVVVDHRVDVGQGPVQDPRGLPVVCAQQRQRHQQLAADHLVRDVGESREVRGVVGFDLRIPQGVVVLAGQVLQAGAEEAQLDGDAEVQQAAEELRSLGGGECGEPAVHPLSLDAAPALHHPHTWNHLDQKNLSALTSKEAHARVKTF